MKLAIILSSQILLGGLLSLSLEADVLIQSIVRKPDSATTGPVDSSFERGYRFKLGVDALVTHLSLYDVDQDGLAGSYRVTLWDASGTILARTTVGNTDPFDASGQFRTHPLATPLTISANTVYVLSANYADVSAPDELLASAVESGALSPYAQVLAHGIAGPSPIEAANALLSFGVGNPDPIFPTDERTFSHGGTVSLQFTPDCGPCPDPVKINEVIYDPVSGKTGLAFHTITNISFRIESSTDLMDWDFITSAQVAWAGTDETVTDLPGVPGKTYFRVSYLLIGSP